mgnify:CR=1 FL=1
MYINIKREREKKERTKDRRKDRDKKERYREKVVNMQRAKLFMHVEREGNTVTSKR